VVSDFNQRTASSTSASTTCAIFVPIENLLNYQKKTKRNKNLLISIVSQILQLPFYGCYLRYSIGIAGKSLKGTCSRRKNCGFLALLEIIFQELSSLLTNFINKFNVWVEINHLIFH